MPVENFLQHVTLNNNNVRFMAIVRYITERKTAQKKREKLIEKLRSALTEIKTLRDILPICCICRLFRDDAEVEQGKGEWMKVDKFVIEKTDDQESNGYCPQCCKKAMQDI